MYVTAENDREYCLRFWAGKPSEALLWSMMGSGYIALSKARGYASYQDFCAKELGCVQFASVCIPFKSVNPNLQINESERDGMTVREYNSPHGILHETLLDGQIIDYKIKNCDDLKILNAMLMDTRIEADFERYQQHKQIYEKQMPIIVNTDTASAVQQFLQYETGVVNFWYLAEDYPKLLEECMETFQSLMAKKYLLMQQVESDGFYQAENTSSAMISPEYYRKYGVPQVRQFVDSAHAVGKRAIVHMCGHLYNLMPLIKETGMNGIHSLTPPPIGNTSFEYAYSIMPSNTSILGRLGSLEWIGKNKMEIKESLCRLLPHRIYHEHPFMLIVSTDDASFSVDDLYNVRDAIAEYEQEGNGIK